MEDTLNLFVVALLNQKGIGAGTFYSLLTVAGNSVQNIYDLNIEEKYRDQFGKSIVAAKNDMQRIRELLANKHVSFVTVIEEGYPNLLKEMHNPPPVLFYKGEINQDKLQRSLGVVGTRKMTEYGKLVTNNFVRDLVLNDYAIISGMAMGIDREAHTACLDNDGYTIAVLASSVDNPTPSINYDIYKRILDSGGAVVSDLFPGKEVFAGMFAVRNRIIAGLSNGVLVVEAPEKSGSLITADIALEFNREVFAIPGQLNAKNSTGTNKYIKNGVAKLVQSAKDIFEEFKHESEDKETNVIINNLTKHERNLYDLLAKNPLTIEEMINGLKAEYSVVVETCFELELKNLVIKDKVGRYIVK